MSQVLVSQSTNTALQVSYAQLQASHLSASNQQIFQTATESSVVQSATQAIAQASATLLEIKNENNQYQGLIPSFGGNLTFTILFALALVVHTGLGFWYKQWWVMVSFFCGSGLEMAGFLTRTMSHDDYDVQDYFLCQIISLTIAPAFIMGGIYILLGKFIIIYGPQFALMRPMFYSYIFMTCDFISLVIQAVGGALAASADTESGNEVGTHIMVGGLAFQVVSMTIYVILYLHFFHRIKFHNKDKYREISDDFNPRYRALRSRMIFQFFPYVVFICVGFVYIRCVYRVVELAEGWSGYLITHEMYLFFLDALMIALTTFTLIIFHPGIVFDGRNTSIEVVRNKNKIAKRHETAQSIDLQEIKDESGEDFKEVSGSFTFSPAQREVI